MPSTLQPISIAPKRSALDRVLNWATAVNTLALLAACLAFRWVSLDHLPGINGDEAWYGVQVERILQGKPFDWRTPTGNLINPFYLGPLLLVHVWLAPSGFALRLVAATSGTLALAANFWLCRKSLGWTTAVISTMVLALLPINIAYSRFGWDASQSVLATLLVVHCSLLAIDATSGRSKWAIATVVAMAAAVIVHPTNVFVVIVPAVGFGLRAWALNRISSTAKSSGRQSKPLPATVAIMMALGLLTLSIAPAHMTQRIASGEETLAFAIQFGRLFSGGTAYRYISGAIPADPPGALPGVDALRFSDVVVLLIAGLAVYGLWRWRRRFNQLDGALLIAAPTMVVAFYIVAGPHAIAPHFERYALCLVAPTVLLASRGLVWWLASGHDRLHCGKLAAAVIGWVIVANFWSNYFDYMRRTGGDSHVAFRTADSEPKAQAVQYVLKQAHSTDKIIITTNEWWNYWPLAYLASREVNVHVLWCKEPAPGNLRKTVTGSLLWSVEFAGSTAAREMERLFRSQGPYQLHTIADPQRRSILTLLGPLDDSQQKD